MRSGYETGTYGPNFEVWLVDAINKEMITEDAVGVKHVRDLIIYVELPISDGQRQVEPSGWERRRISRIIHNVEAGKTHPHVATGNVHAVIVVKMHRPALIHSIFK